MRMKVTGTGLYHFFTETKTNLVLVAAPASYGIPALVYPAAAYSYYPSAAYPSTAYFPTTPSSTGLTQKDI